MSGRPAIFNSDEDTVRFQEHISSSLGVAEAAKDVLIVGSAKTGFSLDPDRYFGPFRDKSDIDIVVVHQGLFDEAWRNMLAWDYLTMKNRTRTENDWLFRRHCEVWSGCYYPKVWRLRDQGGIDLSFPEFLKPLRRFSFQWFSTFRSLGRYKYHPEIPRHDANARLYRTRKHVAMYHAVGLKTLRTRLLSSE